MSIYAYESSSASLILVVSSRSIHNHTAKSIFCTECHSPCMYPRRYRRYPCRNMFETIRVNQLPFYTAREISVRTVPRAEAMKALALFLSFTLNSLSFSFWRFRKNTGNKIMASIQHKNSEKYSCCARD